MIRGSRWLPAHTHTPASHPAAAGLATQSCLTLATLLAAAHPAPLSTGLSRQEHWGALPFPSPGDLPDPGIQPGSPALQADSLLTELRGKPKPSLKSEAEEAPVSHQIGIHQSRLPRGVSVRDSARDQLSNTFLSTKENTCFTGRGPGRTARGSVPRPATCAQCPAEDARTSVSR